MPWRNGGVAQTFGGTTGNGGGQAQTVFNTYTVPAGRRLWLSSAAVSHFRVSPPTTLGATGATGWIALPPFGQLVWAWLGNASQNVVNDMPGNIVLEAGRTVVCSYVNTEAGGYVYTWFRWSGILFDA